MYLDEAIKRLVKETARRRKVSEAVVIREALRAHLAESPPPKLRPVGRSKDGGVAHRLDQALKDTGFGRSPAR